MFQSLSTDEFGQTMAKKNVFATEFSNNEWELAPTLLDYTRSVLLQTPMLLNCLFPHLKMSELQYGIKLAVSLGEGSKCTSNSLALCSIDGLWLTAANV